MMPSTIKAVFGDLRGSAGRTQVITRNAFGATLEIVGSNIHHFVHDAYRSGSEPGKLAQISRCAIRHAVPR
jgi:hypothetical protein